MQLRLKELREDLCLSVKDMARDTGVSQNTIHYYFNNNNDGKLIKWKQSRKLSRR